MLSDYTMEQLEERIGYKFGNQMLLKQAVTHSSFANEQRINRGENYERLEFLGDSILGFKSHMGAGSITSNVKSDKTLVAVRNGGQRLETGRKKFGAILGDHVEVGCNSVLNPGTIVGRASRVYPLSSVRGAVPPDSIFKGPGTVVHQA